jgi:two-component system, sensor histidine kinase RegB
VLTHATAPALTGGRADLKASATHGTHAPDADDTADAVAAPVITGQWLVRFRWAVALGAALTLAVAWTMLGLRFPVAVVTAAIAVQLASNLWLSTRVRHGANTQERTLGAIVLLDVVLLTLLMLTTGGPSNPFTISYLVYITLAAIILRAPWTMAVTAACMAGYASLFITPLRAPFDPHATHAAMQPGMGHQVGMWVAFLVAAALTATFVTRIRVALEARERALQHARRLAARQERLASLTTLAAGAAHELATPLATIATAAVELELGLSWGGFPDSITEDARLVRRQVERCREILDQMSGRADPSVAHEPQRLDAATIVDRAIAGLNRSDHDRVRVTLAADLPSLHLPLEAAARVLRSLINNALLASQAMQPVSVLVDAHDDTVRLRVVDEGVGMTPDILARAGEPFYTTRPAGAGFGLGLFLVRTFADQWGGRFDLSSTAGVGTTATLSLPLLRT